MKRDHFLFFTLASVTLLSACTRTTEPPVAAGRPVRTIVIRKQDIGDPLIVTGHLRARDEVSLAFRLSGKLIQRDLDVGDTVRAGQKVALLDAEVERSARDAAKADLLAAQAVLDQADASEKRQRRLLEGQVVSRDAYDIALRQLKTAKAQVDAAQARLKSAEEQLGYTELIAEHAGVITQTGAEPGEVVRAGQMILVLARQGGRDAVFDVPAQVIRDGLSVGQDAEVWLADSQDIRTIGRIREISPQADPITRNYRVKVELLQLPEGMFLGATVVGRLRISVAQRIDIPSTALTMHKEKPAVWIVDGTDMCVHRREITIERYTPNSVIVADGLQPGERIVTAGTQELHEGQAVKLLGDPS